MISPRRHQPAPDRYGCAECRRRWLTAKRPPRPIKTVLERLTQEGRELGIVSICSVAFKDKLYLAGGAERAVTCSEACEAAFVKPILAAIEDERRAAR